MTKLTLAILTLAVALTFPGEAEAFLSQRYFLTTTATNDDMCKTEAAINDNIINGVWRANNTFLAVNSNLQN